VTTELNPRFTYDTFVVGQANRLAVTAGRTVAENPGSAYNPLFIYANSGLGKTHLLMSIGHGAKQLNPKLNVEYMTLDEFVEAFNAAVAQGQGDAFRRRFQGVDILLLDDVQFLTNRKEMQAELLRLTGALQTVGHQIVLTSDRPPAEIADLDERLIGRFSGGLVVDIGPPDYETRVAILRRKTEERGTTFQAGVLEVLASLNISNVRELLGGLNKLVAYQAVNESPLAPEEARQLLGVQAVGGGANVGAGAPAGQPRDEFAQFLSDVTTTVAKSVEAWRARVAEAIMRWEGEGYRTRRLEALLEAETPAAVDPAIAAFVADVEKLRELEAEVSAIDPQAGGDSLFRDPGRLADAEALAEKVREGATPPPAPSPAFSLDGFAAGPSNEVAVSAARALIKSPGKKYNPLVIVGKSGVGKTHLLHAIGNALGKKGKSVVACLSTPAFVDELIGALEADRMTWWRARYRRVTALLLDDIHLLAGKDRTQEELFNLFNHLVDAERQLVFTSPVLPQHLQGIEARIITRLEGGLVSELAEPDRDVRGTVLAKLIPAHRLEPDTALLDYLADRPVDSVRALTGLVQRVAEAAESRGVPATAGLAREVLEGRVSRGSGQRRTAGLRTSGIVVSVAGGLRSREKVLWEWPDPNDRVIEEWG
jgi:chromosomal replication initiator protein